MLELFLYEMRKRRTAIIGWSIGMSVYFVYILLLYPTIGDQYGELLQNLDVENSLFQMFGDLGSMSSFSGFFALYAAEYLPLMLAIYAITNGTAALAGEEEEGTLELLLAQPLGRWQIVMAKAAAMMLAVFVVLLVTAIVTVVTFSSMQAQISETPVTEIDLLMLILFAWPVVMVFMMLSLFLGAYMPRRRMAVTVVTLLLVASFFGNNLAGISEALERMQFLFAFHYYDGQAILTEGVPLSDLAILLGAVVFFLALALISFQRRDVTVGAWPWHRARARTAAE